MLDSRCGFMANGEFLFAAASSLLDERDAIFECVCVMSRFVCVSQNSHNNGPGALTPTVQQLRGALWYNWIAAITKKLRVKNTVHVVHGGRNPPQKETCAFCPKNLLRRNIIYVKLNTLWRLFCFNYRLLRFEATTLCFPNNQFFSYSTCL